MLHCRCMAAAGHNTLTPTPLIPYFSEWWTTFCSAYREAFWDRFLQNPPPTLANANKLDRISMQVSRETLVIAHWDSQSDPSIINKPLNPPKPTKAHQPPTPPTQTHPNPTQTHPNPTQTHPAPQAKAHRPPRSGKELLDDLCELSVARTVVRLATGAAFRLKDEEPAEAESGGGGGWGGGGWEVSVHLLKICLCVPLLLEVPLPSGEIQKRSFRALFQPLFLEYYFHTYSKTSH